MTNTIYRPTEIQSRLTEARELVRRLELSQRYVDEAELLGLAPDQAFSGADAVLLSGDYLLALDVRDWECATVEITLCRIVPDGDDATTEDLWSVRLIEVPWQLFSVTLLRAIESLHAASA